MAVIVRSSGASTSNSGNRTVYAISPPAGLTAIAANGTTNDSAALQAMLTWVKGTYGAGRVQLPPGATIKCNTGLVLPAGVQLVSDESTTIDFTGIGTGTAITINDNDFTPLIGVSLTGPNSSRSLVNASIGVSVTGARLRLYNLQVKEFGRGVDMAHSDTWLVSIIGGSIWNCGTCVYLDNTGAAANNAGEEMVLDNVTLYNSTRAIHATGNGVDLKVTNSSIDYCTTFGELADAWVYFTGCHLESQGGVSGTYLFNVTHNAKVSFANTDVIMGAGTTSALTNLFNPDEAPWNFGNGAAHFINTKIYSINPTGGDVTHFSHQLLEWPASTTTMTLFTPFPLRWCMTSARFVAQDFRAVPNGDQIYVSGLNLTNRTFTLTSPSNASDRWVRFTFS